MSVRKPARLLTQADAARVLGITRQAINSYIRQPLLDVKVVAGVRLITRQSVDRMLARRAQLAKAKEAK